MGKLNDFTVFHVHATHTHTLTRIRKYIISFYCSMVEPASSSSPLPSSSIYATRSHIFGSVQFWCMRDEGKCKRSLRHCHRPTFWASRIFIIFLGIFIFPNFCYSNAVCEHRIMATVVNRGGMWAWVTAPMMSTYINFVFPQEICSSASFAILRPPSMAWPQLI